MINEVLEWSHDATYWKALQQIRGMVLLCFLVYFIVEKKILLSKPERNYNFHYGNGVQCLSLSVVQLKGKHC